MFETCPASHPSTQKVQHLQPGSRGKVGLWNRRWLEDNERTQGLPFSWYVLSSYSPLFLWFDRDCPAKCRQSKLTSSLGNMARWLMLVMTWFNASSAAGLIAWSTHNATQHFKFDWRGFHWKKLTRSLYTSKQWNQIHVAASNPCPWGTPSWPGKELHKKKEKKKTWQLWSWPNHKPLTSLKLECNKCEKNCQLSDGQRELFTSSNPQIGFDCRISCPAGSLRQLEANHPMGAALPRPSIAVKSCSHVKGLSQIYFGRAHLKPMWCAVLSAVKWWRAQLRYLQP